MAITEQPPVVSYDEWQAARIAHLKNEKALTHLRDLVTAERRKVGELFHTYSTYARGLDDLLGANHHLDLTPKGRDEAAYPDWPRRRDEYPPASDISDGR